MHACMLRVVALSCFDPIVCVYHIHCTAGALHCIRHSEWNGKRMHAAIMQTTPCMQLKIYACMLDPVVAQLIARAACQRPIFFFFQLLACINVTALGRKSLLHSLFSLSRSSCAFSSLFTGTQAQHRDRQPAKFISPFCPCKAGLSGYTICYGGLQIKLRKRS